MYNMIIRILHLVLSMFLNMYVRKYYSYFSYRIPTCILCVCNIIYHGIIYHYISYHPNPNPIIIYVQVNLHNIVNM